VNTADITVTIPRDFSAESCIAAAENIHKLPIAAIIDIERVGVEAAVTLKMAGIMMAVGMRKAAMVFNVSMVLMLMVSERLVGVIVDGGFSQLAVARGGETGLTMRASTEQLREWKRLV